MRPAVLGVSAALTLGAWLVAPPRVKTFDTDKRHRAPEFPTQDPERWVGDPVTLASLRGRVVLIDVWTFG